MTKKIILAASILGFAVLVVGLVLILGFSEVEAAKQAGGMSSGCERVCFDGYECVSIEEDEFPFCHPAAECFTDCPGEY